jgi:hypothetical protein
MAKHNKIEIEWFRDNKGLIVKKRGKRITYPDPFCEDDFLEAHFGNINWMRMTGKSAEEVERVHQEFCVLIGRPQPANVTPMPKTFSAEDAFRARGMGITLD